MRVEIYIFQMRSRKNAFLDFNIIIYFHLELAELQYLKKICDFFPSWFHRKKHHIHIPEIWSMRAQTKRVYF